MISNNEWDPLKKVVVGVADNAKIPEIDISVRTVNYSDKNDSELKDVVIGPYPNEVLDQANEDLEVFCNFLIKEGVEVLRPNKTDCGYYNYCPRDTVLHYQGISVPAPMALKVRKEEYRSFRHHLENVRLIEYDHKENLYDINCVGNKKVLAINESNPAFDAANVVRANDKLLYLVSNSGNKKGAEQIKEIFNVDVCLLEDVYSYMHIDSTVALLRDGLMLVNPSRIKSKESLPTEFRNWDMVICPEPFDIGHFPGYCNASAWTNMNLFSVNPNLVVLEEHHHDLRKELEKHNIDCAMLPMRQARTLGGCFHCVTLDLERDHY